MYKNYLNNKINRVLTDELVKCKYNCRIDKRRLGMKFKNKSMLLLTIGAVICTSIGVFANNEIEAKNSENSLEKSEMQGGYTLLCDLDHDCSDEQYICISGDYDFNWNNENKKHYQVILKDRKRYYDFLVETGLEKEVIYNKVKEYDQYLRINDKIFTIRDIYEATKEEIKTESK